MTVKLNKLDGTNASGKNPTELIVLLAMQAAKAKLEEVAALTDNSAGDPTPTADTIQEVAAFVEVADAGTTSAQKANAETILGTVKDAVTELATKANAMAAKLGIEQLTDNSGGTTADGTIGAIDQTVTAATTGAQDTATNANRVLLNDAFLELGMITNRIAKACGVAPLNIDIDGTANGTIAALTTDVGTAADPAISATAFNAAVVKWADNVAYIAAKLNECRASTALEVVVV